MCISTTKGRHALCWTLSSQIKVQGCCPTPALDKIDMHGSFDVIRLTCMAVWMSSGVANQPLGACQAGVLHTTNHSKVRMPCNGCPTPAQICYVGSHIISQAALLSWRLWHPPERHSMARHATHGCEHLSTPVGGGRGGAGRSTGSPDSSAACTTSKAGPGSWRSTSSGTPQPGPRTAASRSLLALLRVACLCRCGESLVVPRPPSWGEAPGIVGLEHRRQHGATTDFGIRKAHAQT